MSGEVNGNNLAVPIAQRSHELNGPVDAKLAQVKLLLNDKYHNDNVTADQLMSKYGKLARKMLENGSSNEDVLKAFVGLENNVSDLMTIFKDMDLDKMKIRTWLSKVIEKRMGEKYGDLEKNSYYDPISEIKIGRDELYLLVNATREEMGLFERQLTGFPVRDVTKQAFVTLFDEDQNHKYDPKKDDVSLAVFTSKLKNEVLVFAGTVSSNALEKTLDLFATRRFFLIDKDMMVHQVKYTLYNLAMKNIEAEYPPDKDGSVPGNKEKRKFLIHQLRTYYHDTSGKNQMVNNMILGKNNDDRKADENGKETEKPFNYLKGYEKTALLAYIGHVTEEREKTGIVPDKDTKGTKDVFYLAGLATLCGEHGLLRYNASIGGKDKDVYNLDIKGDKSVSEALISMIVNDYGLKALDEEKWDGVTHYNYSPNGRSMRDQINWLKKKERVDAEVAKVDKEKPERPVPQPDVNDDNVGVPAASKETKPAENNSEENKFTEKK